MQLTDHLSPDTTFLTPNRRLSATLLKQFHQQLINQKKSGWPSIDILPLSSWLDRLWNDISIKQIEETRAQLTPNQEIILWEEILRKSPENDFLLQLSKTAELAKSAWELLTLWEIDINHPALALTDDGQIFQQWAREFQKQCQKNNWIDLQGTTRVITEKLLLKIITPPKKIILIGFTEISPQHKNLFSICEQLGSKIIHYQSPSRTEWAKKISLTDEETEIRTMARWARAISDILPNRNSYQIGCVIPRLEELRETVLSIFTEVFSEKNTFTADHTLLPFNISAGKNMPSFPIIYTALELLKLQPNYVPIETMSHLLHSPFLGEAEQEMLKRAAFDNRLRNANRTIISLKELISPADSTHLVAACPALAKRFSQFLNYRSQLKKIQPISAWVKSFIDLLTLLGWPGERSLDSHEYQVTHRWLDLLTEYATFDNVLEPQDYGTALHYFIQLSAKTVFQPQTPDAPVQILGVLEAAGLPFDYIWVMGMDDNHWPPPPRPNPFIPQRLQKTLQMPHATAEREFQYCQQITQQLTQSAKQIIFSHALKNDDADLRPASLLNGIEEIAPDKTTLKDSISPAKIIFQEKRIELFEDDIAPPVSEQDEIRGGTRIFKQQAACPFKAFAELRLHARRPETPTPGLRPMERGNIVHKALELIWREIKNSASLKILPTKNLQEIIHRHAKKSLELVVPFSDANQRYLSLELQRLSALLLEWLEIEKTRPAFKVIFQEHEKSATIGPVKIKMRVDRIDELEDDHHLIIDYKTGKYNNISSWFGERPLEPQLPLYCIIHEEKNSGIAFAQVHPEEMTLTGLSKKNSGIKSVKLLAETTYTEINNWEQQLQQWRSILEKLGHDFYQGIATVDPKEKHATCRDCHLQMVCRVYEK